MSASPWLARNDLRFLSINPLDGAAVWSRLAAIHIGSRRRRSQIAAPINAAATASPIHTLGLVRNFIGSGTQSMGRR